MVRQNKIKREVLIKVCNFYLLDDLFELAEAQTLIKKILSNNGFPTRKYTKWLKQEKVKS